MATSNLSPRFSRLTTAATEYRSALADFRAHAVDEFKAARRSLGLSQRALAERLGVTHTYLSKVENGKTWPGRGLLAKFCKMLTGEDGNA